ncbi:hypothetical protein Gferi_01220 [Geosporobacter ferrireducens]|uniref:Uncharacterized protein n=1 Tax=Geosporobacter ferrireducens TaxID=1424294 RepID=A0A1D8GBR9_9FIRM|nr:hypothetical protein Gferi_01220 [Geosporobacter ferrireducens]
MFEHQLNNRATIFTIKNIAKVLLINSMEDIVINIYENGRLYSNLTLRKVKIAGDMHKQLERLG